jgi:uncharacterized membrane protein
MTDSISRPGADVAATRWLAVYFTEGVVRAWSDPAPGRWLALLEVFLCLMLFTACALHVRWRQRSARRTAEAAGG